MPSERLAPAEALQHPFVQENAAKPEFQPMKVSMIDNIRAFTRMNAMKKAALQVIGVYVEPRVVKKLKDVLLL